MDCCYDNLCRCHLQSPGKEFTNDTNLYTLFYKLIGQLKHGLINCLFVDL